MALLAQRSASIRGVTSLGLSISPVPSCNSTVWRGRCRELLGSANRALTGWADPPEYAPAIQRPRLSIVNVVGMRPTIVVR